MSDITGDATDLHGTPRRILDAAERVFSQFGYHGASTRAICDRANANIGLIAYHFGTKEGLFEALVAYRAADLNRRVNQAIDKDDSPSRSLQRFLAVTARYLVTEHPSFLVIALRESLGSEASPLSEIVAAHLAPHRERMAEILEAGVRENGIRPIDPAEFYCAMMGALAASVGLPAIAPKSPARHVESVVAILETAVLLEPLDTPHPENLEPEPSRPEPPNRRDDEDSFEIGVID